MNKANLNFKVFWRLEKVKGFWVHLVVFNGAFYRSEKVKLWSLDQSTFAGEKMLNEVEKINLRISAARLVTSSQRSFLSVFISLPCILKHLHCNKNMLGKLLLLSK